MKTFVIGDIHGCLEELKELLTVGHHQPGDRVILVGDLMDRGPDPVGVVRFARKEGFDVIKGNHEEKAHPLPQTRAEETPGSHLQEPDAL